MKKKTIYTLIIFAIFILSVGILNGCSGTAGDPEDANKPPLSPSGDPDLLTAEVVLYFSDDQAMYLVPEDRQVEGKKDEPYPFPAGAIVNALLSGPQENDLRPTIPPEAKLLSLEIKDKIAIVNFSEEFKTKHGGGSTGELMTIYSLVNSLTELENIEQVQILINGQKAETLAGHLTIDEPLNRDESLLK